MFTSKQPYINFTEDHLKRKEKKHVPIIQHQWQRKRDSHQQADIIWSRPNDQTLREGNQLSDEDQIRRKRALIDYVWGREG